MMKFSKKFNGRILVENPSFMVVIEEHETGGISLVPWYAVIQGVGEESVPTGEWRRGSNRVFVLCAEEVIALKQYLDESVPQFPDAARPPDETRKRCTCRIGRIDNSCLIGKMVGNHPPGSYSINTTVFSVEGKIIGEEQTAK